MKYSNIPSAQILVLSCKAVGIKDIVISPGSRNAPLILSFTEDPYFRCYSIVDERSAGFFALGMTQYQGSPTALVCTSGSALLNYYPAVSEAFYSDIPLVVISADRPPYKIDVGDGQTIRQDFVFDRHIGHSANLQIDSSHAVERLAHYYPDHLKKPQEEISDLNKQSIKKAFEIAFKKRLPIHINIPFEEPLYGREKVDYEIHMGAFSNPVNESLPWDEIRQVWSSASRKMVLVGVHPPDTVDTTILDALADDPSIVVFTETTSNLYHPKFFPSIDSIIFPIEKSKDTRERFEELRPEVLLTFGGLVVSKKVKAFLRQFKPKYHWHVHETKAYDTFFSLSEHFKMGVNTFLKSLLIESKFVSSTYQVHWSRIKEKYERDRDTYLKEIGFSDFLAFSELQKSIPNKYQVHLSNSSTVRYAQLFDMPPGVVVYCNRGTSGIDGSTSTAIGSAVHAKTPTLLITGDLSFFYDSNAFWNAYFRTDLRIVVINNSGGGIFRILPGFDASERFGKFFETNHNLTAENQCRQYGLEYHSAKDIAELKTHLESFYSTSESPKLLEIFTPREVNNEILLGYFDFISSDYR